MAIKVIQISSILNAKSGEGNYRKFSKDSEEFRNLVKSVKEHGVQTPITVSPVPGKKRGTESYHVVSGFRRTAAALAAGLTEIPASVTEMAPSMAGLLGNQLDEVHPYYTCVAVTQEVGRLIKDGMGKDAAYAKVAETLGKSKSYITNLYLSGTGLSGKVMARWGFEADPANKDAPRFIAGTDGVNKIRLMKPEEQDARLAEWLGAKGDKGDATGAGAGAGAGAAAGGSKKPSGGMLDKAIMALQELKKNADALGHDTSYLDGALAALEWAKGDAATIEGPNDRPIFTPPVKKERKKGEGKKNDDAGDDSDDAE